MLPQAPCGHAHGVGEYEVRMHVPKNTVYNKNKRNKIYLWNRMSQHSYFKNKNDNNIRKNTKSCYKYIKCISSGSLPAVQLSVLRVACVHLLLGIRLSQPLFWCYGTVDEMKTVRQMSKTILLLKFPKRCDAFLFIKLFSLI